MDPAKAERIRKREWIRKPEMPDQWIIGYEYKEMHLKFRLGLNPNLVMSVYFRSRRRTGTISMIYYGREERGTGSSISSPIPAVPPWPPNQPAPMWFHVDSVKNVITWSEGDDGALKG